MGKPVRINLTRSIAALSEFTDNYNKRFDPRIELTSMIRANTLAVAERLLKILSRECSAGKATGEHGTMFRTNTKAVAKLTKNSRRTIQRQLNRLELAGIITYRHPKEAPTGENMYHFNYYVELNPVFVIFQEETGKNTVDNSVKPVDNHVDNMLIVENSPFLESLSPEKAESFKQLLNNELINFKNSVTDKLSHISVLEPLELSRTITRTLSGFIIEKKSGIVKFLSRGPDFFSKLEPGWNSCWNIWNRFAGGLAAKWRPQKQAVRAELEQIFRGGAGPGGQKKSIGVASDGLQKFFLKARLFSRDSSKVAPLHCLLRGLSYGNSLSIQSNFS